MGRAILRVMSRSIIKQQLRAERARDPAHKLNVKLQDFYAGHAVSIWQRERVSEIRAMCDEKLAGLSAAHDMAAAQVFTEYMEYELEYLETSHRLKSGNGGAEPYHADYRRFFSKAFWQRHGARAISIIYGNA